ncbi:hypothetical protein AKJ56_00255 [candidate division MSBL1 archaeon SCGC-AAA382N08]|uniref:Major facilitator superfamily (MFS) profile domain-containing protein n=1 Tax=candidate division MSBL1 archaeon SCGC-AAA382N08 TaxID=1698285 RepID=A0A133VQT4_9EURY|nr:hypothetical protein AKJ56_00255 [candidate division MSBL1 archaeon SCGC-AAA382N08]
MSSDTRSLSQEEIETGLRNVLRDGLATRAMVTLTEGIFLVGFALKMGAPLFYIGLLAAIPPLAQLIQLPSILLVERVRDRRKISVYSSIGSRICLLLIALIPFLFSPIIGLTLLLTFTFARGAFGAVGASSWNSWMRDLIPQESLGQFFSKRWSQSIALSIPIALGAGYFIESWVNWFPDRNPLTGYSIIFSTGFTVGILGIYFLLKTPEPKMPNFGKKPNILELINRPFGDKNFRQLMAFLGSWNFAIFLASPFFTVYILNNLNYGMTTVIVLTVLTQTINVLFFQIWGRFSDQYSNKSVLGVSGPIFLISILLWTFTTMPEKYFLTVPLLIIIHVLMGISLAGVNLATGNIGLKLAPRGQGTSYLAAISLVGSLSIGIGPILGGIIANTLVDYKLSLTLNLSTPSGTLGIQTLYFQGLDFAFLFAFLIGVYSIYRLAFVVEEGEIEKKVVYQELLSEIKRPALNFTTAAGFWNVFQYPLTTVKKRLNRKR